jgi:von Willebrand factor type A domain
VSLTILTPLGALLALGIVLPLVALLRARRKASGVRGVLGVEQPRRRALAAPLAALALGAMLLGLAAAQPVFEWTRDRTVRMDAEAFVVVDVSRSMLAQEGTDSPQRLERARAVATSIRASLPDIPVGVATLTDRVLPHLFPTTDQEVFEATLQRSIGIEKPPPRSSLATGATSLNALATLRGLRFFTPNSTARLAIVLTDGESQPVSNARLGGLFRRAPAIEVVFVQFWNEEERVFTKSVPEPQYLPDPSARLTLDRLAASVRGAVYSETQVDAVQGKAREFLGSGPTVVTGEQAGQLALAPYLAAAALLPFGLLLWRRDR